MSRRPTNVPVATARDGDRGAPDRGAPDRVAPDRVAPDRVAPDRAAPTRRVPVLDVRGVCRHFDSGSVRTEVLRDVDLAIDDGEFVAIVGFSGAGKTTLISLLAGLDRPDTGEIRFRDQPVIGPGPERGVVFQSYSLMPWLDVTGNVALAVDATLSNAAASERRELVDRYIELVGLSHARDRRPAELSGGMRQRVAVARALAMRPELLLLDEPLSALDALTRARLQDELASICSTERRTIVLITNDVDEAILLADRVIAMTPAPAATLAREFEVTIARPRERAAMNHDPVYTRLRGEITRYLLALGAGRRGTRAAARVAPTVVPITRSNDTVPKAITDAGRSAIGKRYVEFSRLGKTYPTANGPLPVVRDFDLHVERGEFVTLIGHSGCGKSTVLSMAAGLIDVSEGGIVLDGREVTTAGPDRAVVFQAPSLMPWLTAWDNVALGVERVYPHASTAERADVIDYYLERVGLADAMHRRAADLSNGMRQRVGIARAFALSPKLLLLDEPFGMLDSLTRWELQDVLMDVWTRTKVTAICVTHDVDEALLLADRVVMMSNGPEARVGNVMHIDLPRPRSRNALLAHPDYYAYREELLDFLEAYEGGASPGPEVLDAIRARRASNRSVQPVDSERLEQIV